MQTPNLKVQTPTFTVQSLECQRAPTLGVSALTLVVQTPKLGVQPLTLGVISPSLRVLSPTLGEMYINEQTNKF